MLWRYTAEHTEAIMLTRKWKDTRDQQSSNARRCKLAPISGQTYLSFIKCGNCFYQQCSCLLPSTVAQLQEIISKYCCTPASVAIPLRQRKRSWSHAGSKLSHLHQCNIMWLKRTRSTVNKYALKKCVSGSFQSSETHLRPEAGPRALALPQRHHHWHKCATLSRQGETSDGHWNNQSIVKMPRLTSFLCLSFTS